MSDFNQLCSPCGKVANYLYCLKKFGDVSPKPAFNVSTFHKGTCDICGKDKDITELRDFFYPSDKAMSYIKRYLAGKEK